MRVAKPIARVGLFHPADRSLAWAFAVQRSSALLESPLQKNHLLQGQTAAVMEDRNSSKWCGPSVLPHRVVLPARRRLLTICALSKVRVHREYWHGALH